MRLAVLLPALLAAAIGIVVTAFETAPVQAQRGAAEWDVRSPDGRTRIIVARDASGRLTWRALRGNAVVLAPSPLGLRRADQVFEDGLTLTRAANAIDITDEYRTPYGKRRVHPVRARERTLAFTNTRGARIDLVLRAHNDGVAFRYRFPDLDTIAKTVVEELTGFAVPIGSAAWLQPQQPVGQYGPAYEDFYRQVPSGTPAPATDGWAFPALFRTPGGPWLLISESGFDGTYAGTHLQPAAPDGVYRVAFPDPAEGRGIGQSRPRSALPWTLPWRAVVIGDTAPRILETDLITDLAAPTRLTDTSWIAPGRAAWSWWSDSDSPRHAARLNAFTDLAADMGWEYSLVDANWNLMQTGRIDDVLAHAREKNIGLLLWYNSGGPHNNVSEAPRERMLDRTIRRGEMLKLQTWGVKGIKVDFWHSDKQDRLLQYRAVLQDAADHRLLVNFHGSTIPRGWEREFPHLVGMESVLGAEQYKFRKDFPANAPWHHTVLPFTRNAVGTMDYTPVTFTDHQNPRVTTNAHELALSVVFQTGVQHFADSVAGYRQLPDAAREFLKAVPAGWDETRGLSGEPGASVIVARREGDVWYVGGLAANEPHAASVGLGFLGAGTWTMMLIRDGGSDREFAASEAPVTARQTIDVSMRARGGFVMRLKRQ
jgi:hypothetical protein